jgi:hypothetical protein
MISISSPDRVAIVGEGFSISQRKRLGASNEMCPEAVSGSVSDLSVRVWTKSADQV